MLSVCNGRHHPPLHRRAVPQAVALSTCMARVFVFQTVHLLQRSCRELQRARDFTYSLLTQGILEFPNVNFERKVALLTLTSLKKIFERKNLHCKFKKFRVSCSIATLTKFITIDNVHCLKLYYFKRIVELYFTHYTYLVFLLWECHKDR